MVKIKKTDINGLWTMLKRMQARATKLEHKIHHATTEPAYEAAVNAWENQQELIRQLRIIIADYYELNAQQAVR